MGSASYLYDNQGNRVLTHSTNASSTSNTVSFDSYTETVLSGLTTTTSKYYSPYGAVDNTWGTMPTSYSYADQRLDSQTDLLYDNFRYYDPLPGQYARSDNVQDNSSGMNPYAYVGDNPETRNDPSGHFC